jgi:RNA 2',3'-cyclic 3'-phosphodiesterase
MPRPNWFLAFPLDGSFVLELPELPQGLRRFQAEDVHLTLAFLGGCGEAGAMAALAALDEKLARAPLGPLDVALGEVVGMGGARLGYSALSALLSTGRAEVTEVLAAYRDGLTEAASARREKRAPKPHVTLARPKGRAGEAEREAGLAWASTLDLAHVQQRLDRIALYTWSEHRQERLFQIVAERRLA